MSPHVCLDCGAEIAPESINTHTCIAMCRTCGFVAPPSDMLDRAHVERVLASPPPGCRRTGDGEQFHIEASLRSAKHIALGVFACSLVSVVLLPFAYLGATGLYELLIGPLPTWMPLGAGPAAASGGSTRASAMSREAVTVLCLIAAIPGLLMWLVLAHNVLTHAFGRVQIERRGERAWVRTGFGSINRTKRFDATSVEMVCLSRNPPSHNYRNAIVKRGSAVVIVLRDRDVWTPFSLTFDRQVWLVTVLRDAIVQLATERTSVIAIHPGSAADTRGDLRRSGACPRSD